MTTQSNMIRLTIHHKEKLAKLMRFAPLNRLLQLGVRLSVPRHRTGIGIVGYDQLGRILLLRHVFHPKMPWGLPGGWLERGESPITCSMRELREETGLSANIGPIIYSSFESEPAHIGIAFIAHIKPGEIRLSSEIIDAAWFEPSSLPGPLPPFAVNAIHASRDYIDQWDIDPRGIYE